MPLVESTGYSLWIQLESHIIASQIIATQFIASHIIATYIMVTHIIACYDLQVIIWRHHTWQACLDEKLFTVFEFDVWLRPDGNATSF